MNIYITNGHQQLLEKRHLKNVILKLRVVCLLFGMIM